jgi:hypothetical protein
MDAAANTVTVFEAACESAGKADKDNSAMATTSMAFLNIEMLPTFINPSSFEIMQCSCDNEHYNSAIQLTQ